jgi:hypothetical protein
MKWLDHVPWWVLALTAVALGLAPFQGQPHLLEKLGMLAAGQLQRPLDIFDLLLHASPLLLILLKLWRTMRASP